MDKSDKLQSVEGQQVDDVDIGDQTSDSTSVSSSSGAQTSVSTNPSVARRLTEILVENGDGDLLLQRNDREDGVLEWLRAMDMQVMGACRAAERLKPLLKSNASAGVAEDRLLTHLSQHFEPAEVGMLARCLCIPLVSIRVGKINKQGIILSPTPIRGDLCLTILPNSDFRLLFNGDDGSIEVLATLRTHAQGTAMQIEEISADKSGRSFLIKTSDSVISYYWCSEKSKLLGDEFLGKMKDLLRTKPSLAELTGISESRLNCFAIYLRSYLVGSTVNSAQAGGIPTTATTSENSVDSSESRFPQSPTNCQRSPRFRPWGIQGSKANLIYQASLSPRPNSFKESLQKSSSSMKSASRGKSRLHGENHISCADSLSFASLINTDLSSPLFQTDKHPEADETKPFAASSFLDLFGKSAHRPELSGPQIQASPLGQSYFSPHYCWCPPIASTLQCNIGTPNIFMSSTESPSLPPYSSLLSSVRQPSLATSKPLLNLAEIPPLNLPAFLPEPLHSLPTSQQIPTFTPLICDPIVHIPVIDVFSSGQGYLVSAGTAMPTMIPPLNPDYSGPLLPNPESIAEQGARETLRMLISSSPSVLSSSNDKQNAFVAGSRGLYSGTSDVDAIASSLTTMGLVLLSEKSMGSGLGKRCDIRDDMIDQKERPSNSDSSGCDEQRG